MPTAQPAPAAPDTLPASVAEFVQSGLSISISSASERLVPSICKGVGCRVSAARDRVTVLMFASRGEQVLRDLRRGAPVAVCFSRPSTHQTVQLKGPRAHIEPASPHDLATARRCLDLLIEDLTMLGLPARMLEAFFWHDPAEMVALSFVPEGAFAQTPGPDAGRAIERDAARP
jgi:hypothetical protein